ncbi:hypothetical protein ACF1BS_01630 [Streptomyces sp. NPDC014748]|uniref:hypothetical protein n=1 Tax=unclassified Streptomyces TaxID=2593676 RepID=UPI002D80C6A9|nr:hypothetical protein [Streptomyces sp. GMY02]
MEPQRPGDPGEEDTWASLSPREKASAAVGLAGLGLGILAAVAVVILAGVLLVGFLSGGLIEADSASSVVWAVVLCLPCGLLAGVFATPVRLALRLTGVSDRGRHGADMAVSAATTFLAALLVESFTPGLHVEHPWLPALSAMLLVALANLVINHVERRKSRRNGDAC